jgi:hypothetical protein
MAIAVDTLDGAHVLLVGSAEWTTPLADALETRVGATVETVTTADAALSVLDDHPIECVVGEYALDGRTGVANSCGRSARDRRPCPWCSARRRVRKPSP